MAGVVPGLLLTGLFLVAIAIVTRLKPELGPVGPTSSMAEKLSSLRRSGTFVVIVLATIGGHLHGRLHAGRGGRRRRLPRVLRGALPPGP